MKALVAIPPLAAADFKVGELVKYVPAHAYGDLHHPDCQTGRVTSTNDCYVFVRFKGETSEACDPESLVKTR